LQKCEFFSSHPSRIAARLGYNVDMRRWLSRAAFGLMLLALPVWAQRGGHGGGGGHSGGGGGAHFSSSHGGSAMHSSGSGAFRGGSIAHSGGVRIRSGNPYYNYRGYGRRGYPYYAWGYYPWGWDGWYDNSSNYDSVDQDQNYAGFYQAPASAPYPESGGLQRDLQALNGKIDRLQADVEARNHPKTEEPATALVFRDQHVEEVRNYAISGGTLWVLSDKAAKKIPLAQLDIDATVKMNDDRGVDFQVPR
jgi:hypothetical protein